MHIFLGKKKTKMAKEKVLTVTRPKKTGKRSDTDDPSPARQEKDIPIMTSAGIDMSCLLIYIFITTDNSHLGFPTYPIHCLLSFVSKLQK